MKAYIETYGCTLNKADSMIIEGILRKQGVKIVSTPEKADIIFLNTCAVKLPTERRMIHRIKQLDRLGKRLVVCGCLPKINKKEIRKVSDCTLLDVNSFSRIPDILKGAEGEFFSNRPEEKLLFPMVHKGLTAPIPISTGCLGSCTYCGVRFSRGTLKSYSIKDIRSACENALNHGAIEIQLTSQDCGVYGKDIGTNIIELVDEIVSIPGDFKIRIGMMNPNAAYELMPELLKAFSHKKVYKFVHLPVQSGSNKILKAMRRKYDKDTFKQIVHMFRERYKDISISTDVIIGFPGETEEDFMQTIELLKETRPDITNISKFYPRPNTEASRMKKIPTEVIKKRSVICSDVCRRISFEQNKRYIGKEWNVFVTEKGKKGNFIARAPNYKQIIVKKAKLGNKYRIKVVKAHPSYLEGKIEHLFRK
ncbi:MAG: tRNA (N(6)-L-threonylcarbamoyladenosine(37)-C(2))-methylthiotransferase [Candidatus Diapherotrites archaeon]|nr:tRNA (N(6)-L-threonylcarbamoyladenosine(37)-C(2))-methylthiotransferase [Candidatus Diapherotrites archaeon]